MTTRYIPKLTASTGYAGATIHYDNRFSHPLTFSLRWNEHDKEMVEQGQALARLITSAPELLKVAEYTLNHFTATDNPTPDQIKAREVQLIKAVEIAIKATQ